MDVLAGVIHEKSTRDLHTLSPFILPEVLFVALSARRVQPSLFLVDGETVFLCPHALIVINVSGHTQRIPLVRVTTARFELPAKRQMVARLPIEPPGRPAHGIHQDFLLSLPAASNRSSVKRT